MDYETKDKLQQLSLFLSNLPKTILYADAAQTRYTFSLDDDKIEDMGPIRALNHELECVISQRHNGPISFKERGPGLEAIVDILESHLIEHLEETTQISPEFFSYSTTSHLYENMVIRRGVVRGNSGQGPAKSLDSRK